MLEVTRAASAEDPEAAMAGCLYLGPVWVELDARRHWHTPQGGMHYRWLAFYWRIGDGDAQNPFARQIVALKPSDELFGPEFRELMEVQREVPTEVFENLPQGASNYEAVRAAGYPEAADRMEELDARIKQRQEADRPGAAE